MAMTDDFVSTREWSVIPRLARTIPFGYEIDPEDNDLLLPIPFELEALEVAKKHLKQRYSYRDVAQWLTEVTGRSISHMGLQKRIKNDKTNANKVRGYKLQAIRLQKAIASAEKAAARTGRKLTNPSD